MGLFLIISQSENEIDLEKKAESKPSEYQGGDYSFSVQAIHEMQYSLGKLIEAIETLKTQGDKHADKLDKISSNVTWAKGAFWAAAAILSVCGSIATFFLVKLCNAIIPLLQIKLP